jgi:type VI secretion system protein VasD
MKQSFLALCLPFALACLSGCSTPRIDLALASQPNVNPDHSGRPSPLLVKTFELRNELKFKQTDSQTLFDQPVQALGADLIAADEMTLIPGEARKVAYSPNPDTKYLGVIASFRQMERAQWRMIKAVDAEKKNLIALEFNDTSILIIPEDQAGSWDPEESVKQFQQQLTRPEAQPLPPTQPQLEEQATQQALQKLPAAEGKTARDISTATGNKISPQSLAKEVVAQGSEVAGSASSATTPAPQAPRAASPIRSMTPIK